MSVRISLGRAAPVVVVIGYDTGGHACRRQWSDARTEAARALNLAGTQYVEIAIRAKRVVGLALPFRTSRVDLAATHLRQTALDRWGLRNSRPDSRVGILHVH